MTVDFVAQVASGRPSFSLATLQLGQSGLYFYPLGTVVTFWLEYGCLPSGLGALGLERGVMWHPDPAEVSNVHACVL